MQLTTDKFTVTVGRDGSYQVKSREFIFTAVLALEIDNQLDLNLPWQVVEKSDSKIQLQATTASGSWNACFTRQTTGISIRFNGELSDSHRLVKLYPLLCSALESDHVLTQGAAMGHCRAILTSKYDDEAFTSYHQLLLTKGSETLQLAYPLKLNQPVGFQGKIAGKQIRELQAYSEIMYYGGCKLETAALTLKVAADGLQLLQDYGAECPAEEKNFSQVEPGWNSWDYYRWTITEDEVLKNAELIASDPVLSKHVKRIIIDDGWEYCYGEWTHNQHFPNGMANLAAKLKKMGFKPGLWFAPTIVEPHCRIAQLDYDMLAKGESGQPCIGFSCMARQGFLLDPTQVKVQQHLHQLFKHYADMGYEYFKLDFMSATLNARKFADATVPRSKIQELIMRPIYEAVKNRAEILGCNYRFEAGNRYVDAVRIGADIHASWAALKHNTIAVAARFWMNKKLWINDPDFALCRGFDTSDDPDLTRLLPSLVGITPDTEDATPFLDSGVDLHRPQLELLLSIVLAAGGAVNLSDNLPRLNASGIDLARRVVSAESMPAAIPLDLLHSELPSYWLQQGTKHCRVLLVNWQDKPQERCLDLNQHGINCSQAKNFWNDQPIIIKNNRLTAELQPRSCLLAVI